MNHWLHSTSLICQTGGYSYFYSYSILIARAVPDWQLKLWIYRDPHCGYHMCGYGFICRYGLVPSIIFVITDGSSNNRHKTILAAKALHSTGVMVFSIGIDGAQRPELEGIASDPSLVYQISDYSKLSSLQDIIADETCLSKCLNCLSLFCLTLFPIPLLWWFQLPPCMENKLWQDLFIVDFKLIAPLNYKNEISKHAKS